MHPINRTSIHVTMQAGGTPISIGTAFPFRYNDKEALITAWHNVFGRNPVTEQYLSPTAAIPDELVVRVPYIIQDENGGSLINWRSSTIDLTKDDAEGPVLVPHPRRAEGVDVVAVRITGWDATGALHVNSPALDLKDFDLSVSGDVFIVGYPRNLVGFGSAPIWKRGSFASDPAYRIKGMHKVVLDTATRSGMSGAPVFARSEPFWFPSGVSDLRKATFGYAWKFVGIYTGREGEDDSLAQLGVAWTANAIEELMEIF